MTDMTPWWAQATEAREFVRDHPRSIAVKLVQQLARELEQGIERVAALHKDIVYWQRQTRDAKRIIRDQQRHIKNLEAELRPQLVRATEASA